MTGGPGPLLTRALGAQLAAARAAGATGLACSVDLGRTTGMLALAADGWHFGGRAFPYPGELRDHTVYYWDGTAFAPVARYTTALAKLVPTDWGPPTFELDGVLMLPTAAISPWDDAGAKVALVRPRGKRILDTCGGLGYFAAWCLAGGAVHVRSFEKNPDVRWLRSLNPWSPDSPWSTLERTALEVETADVLERIGALQDEAFDAVLHDPPRFALAGELYSAACYAELARVLRRGGRLFHYTGAPNARSRGRNLAAEVTRRLKAAGFDAAPLGDGVLARRVR